MVQIKVASDLNDIFAFIMVYVLWLLQADGAVGNRTIGTAAALGGMLFGTILILLFGTLLFLVYMLLLPHYLEKYSNNRKMKIQ